MPFFLFLPQCCDFGQFKDSNALIVDINFLCAVFAFWIAGCVNKDFLYELMENSGSKLRDIRVPLHYGKKTLHVCRLAFLCLNFSAKRNCLDIQIVLLHFVVSR